MEFVTEKNGDALAIKVSGRMDAVTAPEFEQACQKQIDAGAKKVVADLSGLEYISSAGLRSILATAKKLKSVGGEIRFCGLSGMVQEVFSVSGFASMFKIHDTLSDALGG